MKENKYFLDTNIFLRLIVKDNKKFAKECEFLFKKIKEGKINAFTSNLVLTEMYWVLKSFYQLPKEQLVEILKSTTKLKNLKIENKENLSRAVELYEKRNIKFIDAVIASHPGIAKKEVIVISYDKDFDKLKIQRREPSMLKFHN